MTQDPLDDRWVFDTCNHLDGAAATRAGFDIQLENPLEALLGTGRRRSSIPIRVLSSPPLRSPTF